MENTLMSVHICSMDKVELSMMLKVFQAFKLRTGLVMCNEEEAEQTYLLSYCKSDVCSWLSVSGTHWHENSFEAASDPLGLAGEFRMGAVRFYVKSNGSAFFELSDPFSYLAGIRKVGDDVPERYQDAYHEDRLKTEYWQEFTDSLATQAAFENVLSAQYHSAEEITAALAPLLHIEQKYLLMDALSGEADTDTVRLHFKTASKDVKKLTVKAAFKRIYGEALKPLGFVWAKTKELCFIRVVNNELIHIIGINDMKPNFIVPFGGIAALYRTELGLQHTYRDMSNWLPSASQFYWKIRTDVDEASDPRLGAKFHYLLSSPDSVSYTMQGTLEAVQRWVLPVLDQVQSLQDFPAYHKKILQINLSFCRLPLRDRGGDAAIWFLLPDLVEQCEQRFAENVVALKKRTAEQVEMFPDNAKYIQWHTDRLIGELEEARQSVHSFAENPEVRQQVLDELERRKKVNLEVLRSYGVL